MFKQIKSSYPILIASLIFILSIIFFLLCILRENNNHFIYCLDDSYIHLTLARNFAANFILAINPGEFAYSTSSPLWTFLLANLIKLFGNNQYYPLFLNIVFSLLLMVYINKILIRNSINELKRLILLIISTFSISLPLLTFIGLEHILQIILVLCLIENFTEIISKKKIIPKDYIYISFITLLNATIRFESFFLIIILSAILIIRRKYILLPVYLLSAIIPVIIIGIYSIKNGGEFLPNTILLKGNLFNGGTPFYIVKLYLINALKTLLSQPVISILLVISLIGYFILIIRKKKLTDNIVIVNLIFMVLTIFHSIFAKFGWLYRYEAYLVCTGIVYNYLLYSYIFKNKLVSSLSIRIFIIVILLIGSRSVIRRGIKTNNKIITTSHNIYEQQYQMSQFLNMYYFCKVAAIHDIGAVSYYSGLKILDLWGLASNDVLKAKIGNYYNTGFLDRILNKNEAKVIIVYDTWFQGNNSLPVYWHKAGFWEIKNNVACAESKIYFYAKDSTSLFQLKRNLIVYSKELPSDIDFSINN